jgi:hypothetical protein
VVGKTRPNAPAEAIGGVVSPFPGLLSVLGPGDPVWAAGNTRARPVFLGVFTRWLLPDGGGGVTPKYALTAPKTFI